jgi:hypothetical protein
MKINRQNLTEDFGSSKKADWLDDFSKNLEKNADYLDNLRTIIKKRKEFGSIDEKMADIKERAGFSLIKDIQDEPIQSKTATEMGKPACACNKNSCQECSPDLFRSLKSIITYIKDLSKDRQDIGPLGILTHLREHPTLRFAQVEPHIDWHKFKDLIQKIIGVKSSEDSVEDEVKYIPEAPPSGVDSAGDIADYMAHAQPG